MRILSWNINGIRTLPQYHPWNTLKTGDAILNELNADIICFQEMKIQRAALQKNIAIPNGFDSFFSFPVTKGGYSGVAVYTNTNTAAPLKAEEGLTGHLQPKPAFSPAERVSPSYPQAHQMEFFPDENGDTSSANLSALDAEGRALVLDFGLFVLINVYCPAETVDTRLPYKMNFHRLLEERVRKLIHEEDREVIVVGDINITAAPIDHGDGHLPSKQADFWSHPPRAWLKHWLLPSGSMVDVIRDVWPERKGMYTCWNTKISARDSNYGTRVDYILLTLGLLPWFKHGDIQPSIRGSDHCPVYVDLHDEIHLESGETLRLRDAMKVEDARRNPPRISARFWDEFKQRLLSNFFIAKVPGNVLPSSTPSSSPPGALLLDQLSQTSATDVSSSKSEQPEESSSTGTLDSSNDLATTANVPPSSLAKRGPSSTKQGTQIGDLHCEEPKKKKRKVGQTKLSSFFIKPPGTTSSSGQSVSRSSSMTTIVDVDETEAKREADELRQLEEDHKLALSLSEPTNTSEMRVTSSSSSSQSKAAWGQLLAPLQPPKCKVHGEPCKEFTVNKPGPNKGKTFFICSRPVGPGYDKGRSERLREEVNVQYRCDFFKWARDVKKAALKVNEKCVLNEAVLSSSTDAELAASRVPP